MNGVSGVNERLKECCPNIDLSQETPISQKRLVTFINNFIISIVEFSDQLSRHCTFRLYSFGQKINRIEAELVMLESKINSIPEVSDRKDVNIDLPKPEEFESCTAGTPLNEEVLVPSSEDNHIKEAKDSEQVKMATNPALTKYHKMVQVGVPIQAVKIKMELDGLSSDLLDS